MHMIHATNTGHWPGHLPASPGPRLVRFICRAALLLATVVALPAGAQGTPPAAEATEVQIPADRFSRVSALPEWVEWVDGLPPAAASDAVVTRLADTHFRVAAEPRVFVHRAMQVNASSHLGAIGQWGTTFLPEYQRLELHRLQILRGGQVIDKTASTRPRFMQREAGAEQGVFSGEVTAVFVIDDVRVGDTLEVAYSLVGANPAFGGRYVDSASWDAEWPVLRRRVRIDAPAARKIGWRVIGDRKPALKPTERTLEGWRRISFEAHDLAAIEPEFATPGDETPWRWIQFSEFRDWSEVVHWAQGLFPASTPEADLAPVLAQVRAEHGAEAKVRRALAFVQGEIRYLSLSFGENSHRPFAPREVLNRRFGDCKDKSLLLVAVLRAEGIDATPVLLSTGMRGGVDKLLPSPLAFDHAIVRVRIDGRTYFLDPTVRGQVSSLDRIGQWHADTRALVIETGGKALTAIGPAPAELLRDSREEKVRVTNFDAPAEMSVLQTFVGVDAERVRDNLAGMSARQIASAVAASTERRYPGAVLVGAPRITDDAERNELRIALDFSLPRYMERDADNWLARYSAANLAGVFNVPERGNRSAPLFATRAPFFSRYAVEITLPENVSLRYAPERTQVDNPAFSFRTAIAYAKNTARLTAELDAIRDRVEPPQLARYMADVQRVGSLSAGSFVIRPVDIVRAESGLPYPEATRQELTQVVQKLGESLSQRTLPAADRAAVLCERALAHAYLEAPRPARDDADAALALAPNRADIVACRGRVAFFSGDFPRSAQHFTRALVLDPDNHEARFLRGMASFAQGDWRQARADLIRLEGDAVPAGYRARARVWLALADRRQGVVVAPLATSETDWLSSAQRMVANQESGERLLDLVEREAPIPLEPARAEAYCFIGEQALAAGNRVKAGAYFKRALAQGARLSACSVIARSESKRLE